MKRSLITPLIGLTLILTVGLTACGGGSGGGSPVIEQVVSLTNPVAVAVDPAKSRAYYRPYFGYPSLG